MRSIVDIEEFHELQRSGAVLILFGGANCNVCKTLRPRLSAMLEQHLPEMQGVYVDCAITPAICAQQSVFSLPVVKAYIDGMLVAQEAGSFSLGRLLLELQRPYSMWQAPYK